MTSQKNISLYTVYHKNSQIISNKYIVPIQLGDKENIPGITLRDNVGNNISSKNSIYCELTAQYWIWKNDISSDYIGLMHYRRIFDFSGNVKHRESKWGVIEESNFKEDLFHKYGWNDSSIEEAIKDYDIILPNKWSVRNAKAENIRQHYSRAKHHHEHDYDRLQDIIVTLHPEYAKVFSEFSNDHEAYFTNMFIFKRTIFLSYCEWLFPILEKIEISGNVDNYDSQDKRYIGYLSERLLNVWITKFILDYPELRLKHLGRVMIHDTIPIENKLLVLPEKLKRCTIALACDNRFCEHMAVVICSILENRKAPYFIEFYILDGGIDEKNKKILINYIDNFKYVSINFLNMVGKIDDFQTHLHFSKDTFSRLFLHEMLPRHDKVIYLDSDVIVLEDIINLFDKEIGNFYLAAVFDYIVHSFCLSDILSSPPMKLPAKRYLESYLGLGDNWINYFQAGVLILNLNKLRETNVLSDAANDLKSREYWFVDQDILNIYCNNSYLSLDPEWNVVTIDEKIISKLPENMRMELVQSQNKPSIIHYAGATKPWNNPNAKFARYYWYYRVKSPFHKPVSPLFSSLIIWSIVIKYKLGRYRKRLGRSLSKRISRLYQFIG